MCVVHGAKITPKPNITKAKNGPSAKTSSTKPEYSFEDDTEAGVTDVLKKNDGKIITIVSGSNGQEKQCQCIIFHKCPTEHVFIDPLTNKS